MHYFGNPRHTQLMIAYMILTDCFWKFQRKIALHYPNSEIYVYIVACTPFFCGVDGIMCGFKHHVFLQCKYTNNIDEVFIFVTKIASLKPTSVT